MGELLLEPLGARQMIPALCFEADFSSFVYSPNTFRQCIHVIIKSVKILVFHCLPLCRSMTESTLNLLNPKPIACHCSGSCNIFFSDAGPALQNKKDLLLGIMTWGLGFRV